MTHVPVTSFEELFQVDPDPWQFASSWYEQRRYEITMACLPRERYRSAFEPGCAIGELTRRLAERCDQVMALDAAPTAVAHARRRCRDLTNVRIGLGELPTDWPPDRFDLVVLSEIGYYFDLPTLAAVRDLAIGSLPTGGSLVAVHWRGVSEAHILSGDVVHACLAQAEGMDHLAHHREEAFMLDAWARR